MTRAHPLDAVILVIEEAENGQLCRTPSSAIAIATAVEYGKRWGWHEINHKNKNHRIIGQDLADADYKTLCEYVGPRRTAELALAQAYADGKKAGGQ